MGQTEDYIIEIIAKQLNGTASASELQRLEDWLNAAPSVNKPEYEAYVEIWEESGKLPDGAAFDRPAAWEKVDRQIRARSGNGQPPVRALQSPVRALGGRRQQIGWMLAAAALLVLLIGRFWLWTPTHSSSSGISLTAETDNRVIDLPDGSVVTLRKGAVLSYPEAFGKGERGVQLQGQGFFDVRKDNRSVFVVHTANSAIRVLGTSFFVSAAGDSVKVTVTSGRVRFADRDNEASYVELSVDESAGLVSHRFVKDTVRNGNYLAWKTGVLDFNNEPLNQVVQDLNSYYGDSVSLSPGLDSAASAIIVKAHFDQEPLSRVLEEIKLTTGLTGREEGDRIVLYHK